MALIVLEMFCVAPTIMLSLWRNWAQRVNLKLLSIPKNVYALYTGDPLTFPTDTLWCPIEQSLSSFKGIDDPISSSQKPRWALEHRETGDLPKVMQLDSGGARIWTQAFCLQKPHLTTMQYEVESEGKWSHVARTHGLVHNLGCLSLGRQTTCHLSCQSLKNEWSRKLLCILAGKISATRKRC